MFDITKEMLCDIINTFATSGKIFTNERQFQLELAMAINKEIEKFKDSSEEYPKVEMEVLSMSRKENEDSTLNEKLYTDIVVSLSKTEHIAIELKCKMSSKNLIYHIKDNEYRTFLQGAYNIGSAQFLEDVERLERLIFTTHSKDTVLLNMNPKNTVIKGYAIILSNEDLYWKETGRSCVYRDLFIKEGNCPKGNLTAKGFSLHLDNPHGYLCKWLPYNISVDKVMYEENGNFYPVTGSKQYNFKYMIMEINK
jgi:hypothetical protein